MTLPLRSKKNRVSCYHRVSLVLLSLAVGCSGGNQSTFSESGQVFKTIDQKQLESILNSPKISADDLQALEKKSVSEVLMGPDLKIPPGASLVLGGARIPNFDKVYSQWQADVAQISKKYKTWGDLRAAAKSQMAKWKYESAKNKRANKASKSADTTKNEPAEVELQLLADSDIVPGATSGMWEKLKNSCFAAAATSVIGGGGQTASSLYTGATDIRKAAAEGAAAPWRAMTAAEASGAAMSEGALAAELAAAEAGAAAAFRAAVATAAKSTAAGVVVLVGAGMWAYYNCRTQKATLHPTKEAAVQAAQSEAKANQNNSANPDQGSTESSQTTNKGRHLMWQGFESA